MDSMDMGSPTTPTARKARSYRYFTHSVRVLTLKQTPATPTPSNARATTSSQKRKTKNEVGQSKWTNA